jgi:uncharacterized membrane protein
MLNTRIDVSNLARAALAYEAIEMEISLSEAASNAILKGVTKEALRLAKLKMGEKTEILDTHVVQDSAMEKLVELTKRPIVKITKKCPIDDDKEAMDFIEANQGKMSGAEIAKTLGRSKSSVNKWIAEKVV